MPVAVSVLILTYNEEDNLPRCLDSLSWCDDICVLDSYSDDRTELIARQYQVNFVQRKFDDYASQRNFGLNEVKYKYPWVLMVDADEEVPKDLVQEMASVIENCDAEVSLFRMKRKDFFLGKWLRRSSGYPTWFGRLAKVGQVKVERSINEEYVTDGEVLLLENHLHHYPFNKGFAAWLEKHNRYSTMEAEVMVAEGKRAISYADFLCSDPTLRRQAVKGLVYRLPFRPLLMFFALYLVRGGFLDGRAGLTFCLLRSFYEFMINCKVKELGLRSRNMAL